MAITTFKADVHHVAGLNVTATSTHHTITVDEPESLGGTDKGPNPVELLLDALGSCQAIAINAFAPSSRSRSRNSTFTSKAISTWADSSEPTQPALDTSGSAQQSTWTRMAIRTRKSSD